MAPKILGLQGSGCFALRPRPAVGEETESKTRAQGVRLCFGITGGATRPALASRPARRQRVCPIAMKSGRKPGPPCRFPAVLSPRCLLPTPRGGGSGRSRGSCAARGPSAGLSQPVGVPLPLSSRGSRCFGHPRPHLILSVGRAPLRFPVIPRPSLLRPRGQGEAAVPSPSPNPEENPEPTPKNAATLPSLPPPKSSRFWHPSAPTHTQTRGIMRLYKVFYYSKGVGMIPLRFNYGI